MLPILKALIFTLILLSYSIKAYSFPPSSLMDSDSITFKLIKSVNFDNLYQVNEIIYRSEQPSKSGFKELESLGIKTILNLRNRMNDKNEAKGTSITLERIKINSWHLQLKEVILALNIIKKAEKPILVHCLHGADRTGIVIAAYLMIFENWSKDAAINEFLDPRFGYHQTWFPKMLRFLQNLDLDYVRTQMQD